MSGHTGPVPTGRKVHSRNGSQPSTVVTTLVRSITVSYLQNEQLAMLAQREACSQARQARLVRLARGARRSSRAAQADAATPVGQPRLVPAPR